MYLDDWHETVKFFHCECYREGLIVTHYENDEDEDEKKKTMMVDIAIWKYGDYHPPRSLKERLRWAWYIIWYGEIFKDHTTLSTFEANRLGKYLIEVSQKGNPNE